MTLFEMKEKLFTLNNEKKSVSEWLAEKASDPSIEMAEIEAKQAKVEDLDKRIAILQKAHDEEEAKAKVAVAMKGASDPCSAEDVKMRAKAAFYRAALTGGDVSKSYEGLGGIPAANADLGNGSALLPKNVSNQLLVEPNEVNPLRGVCQITNISGLEEPKLGFTIEDADLGDVTDKQTANEIAMTGDTVAYGRLKMKVSATVKDTVLHGTDTDLVTKIDDALRSALAMREKLYAFKSAEACALDSTHAHMSFYNAPSGTAVIKQVEGATLYDAIVAAYSDLADEYAANAKIVMRKSDYYGLIKELANNADTLFGSKAPQILGIPVIFCEKATIPVVGDFRYYGINYDIGAIYETDKDAKKGEYYFVFTAWGDQQIRLASAFRQAIVSEDP